MDIAQLAFDRQRKIDNLNASIEEAEAKIVEEQVILDELVRLQSQSTYTMAEINYLLQLPA